MKILLVHPEDSVEAGPWTEQGWDLIVDLGWSGRFFYARQAERSGCRVLSIYDLLDHEQHLRQLRELVGAGTNQLTDSQSFDWWDAFFALHYQQIGQLMLFVEAARQIPENAEIHATRPHPGSRALSILLKREIKFLQPEPTGSWLGAGRYIGARLGLPPAQLIDIAFDKWDTDYRFRRLISRLGPVSRTPAVLLPSAYVNVSRAQVAYARMLPHRRFLLVVTRRSGRRLPLPPNVELRSLASYAPAASPSNETEVNQLLDKWQRLQNEGFASSPVLRLAGRLGMFEGFAGFLKSGMRVREAWREVIAREAITAVLSADEHNLFTRLPVVLAGSRGLRTVSCDHGALDMGFGFRKPISDVHLASGDMAKDYWTAWCGLPADRLVVGGPQKAPQSPSGEKSRDWIVFFSEQYELFSARTQTLYSEVLPELCSLARQTNRKVIIKLHPFESAAQRKATIEKALTLEQKPLIEMRAGPMTPDLFERAWFTMTVESSVAVESTMNGVPCFLCSWFDSSWYDYGKQFAKYSAGHPLDSPERIRQVPHLLEGIRITDATRRGLQTQITPDCLDSILSG